MCSSAEILLTNGRLTDIGHELNSTAGRDEDLKRTLNALEKELRNINATVAHKQQLLDDRLSSGFAGDDPQPATSQSQGLLNNSVFPQISLRKSRSTTRTPRRRILTAFWNSPTVREHAP